MKDLPAHLQKYIVNQDERVYTPVEQASWRYILRQLKDYLSVHAHESYIDGLEKTGIEIESIPKISEVSRKLEKFGWRALPVSGFLPPSVFMELQSLSVLPIASDMRTLDHLDYTPAPDIVHEAAGHAPILANLDFANYLKKYAQVAQKAITSKEDFELYSAIRDLSDIKENPSSTPEQIQKAQDHLDQTAKKMSQVSEAAELSRMNWWTAEYGLIGSLEKPKIFGAGLLSSVGEAKACLNPKVKKLPLTKECIRTSYDITEQQPQLFVAKDFQDLGKVLDDMASDMAFRKGGLESVKKAIRAESVNTIVLDTGLQISGICTEVADDLSFIKFTGPTQLSYHDKQLSGHSKDYHKDGFSTPLGELTTGAIEEANLQVGQVMNLEFKSGITVTGKLKSTHSEHGSLLLLSFENCEVKKGSKVLFDPSWGTFDMAIGQKIPSVFGGPADRKAYGEIDDFKATMVPAQKMSSAAEALNRRYQTLRSLRESKVTGEDLIQKLMPVLAEHRYTAPKDWLLILEAFELTNSRAPQSPLNEELKKELQQQIEKNPGKKQLIEDGVRLARHL